jgi:molybdopterin-binding protein
MEISARNQLKGTVKTVTTDGLMAEVIIDIGGQEIASTITRASAERLGLRSGGHRHRHHQGQRSSGRQVMTGRSAPARLPRK